MNRPGEAAPGIPNGSWPEPGGGPLADLDAALKQIYAQPWRPIPPLLSPRCGLDGHIRHDACRSVICECECHWEALMAAIEPYRRT